jgi:hypothetical protein
MLSGDKNCCLAKHGPLPGSTTLVSSKQQLL